VLTANENGSQPVAGDAERFVIDCACNGDQQAWRRLFEWHFDPVYRFCLILAGGRRDVAEEVSQQAFVTAAARLHEFRAERGNLRAWLYGIARNRCLALDAGERRRRRVEAQPVEPARVCPEADTLVHEVLARLPLEYRRALEDKYLRRQTLKEMAQSYGRSIEAIESLLRRARDRFAPIYESMQNES
jgi:RNA polymerase sigma-70 factor (ECF subfamily)